MGTETSHGDLKKMKTLALIILILFAIIVLLNIGKDRE